MSDPHRSSGCPERPDLRHLSAAALADRATFFLSRSDSLPDLLAELTHRAHRLEAAERLLGLMLTRPPEPPATRARPAQGPAPQQPAEDDAPF